MKKKSFVKFILLSTVLLLCYLSYKIYLVNNKITKITQYEQIKIPMNEEVIWDDVTKKALTIKNKDGQPIGIYAFLSTDKKTIIINPPIGGFISENTYCISISPNIHLKSHKMNKKKEIFFKVENQVLPTPLKLKQKPKYGDIIGTANEFMGYKYYHYGVYVGNNKVIHYCSNTGKVLDTEIKETAMDTYFKEGQYFILDVGNAAKFNPEETVKRAKEKLGEKSYNLLQNNCEHFAVWAKTSNSKSYQLDNLSKEQIAQIRLFMSMGINLQ